MADTAARAGTKDGKPIDFEGLSILVRLDEDTLQTRLTWPKGDPGTDPKKGSPAATRVQTGRRGGGASTRDTAATSFQWST